MSKSTEAIREFLSRVTGFSISTPLGGVGLSWSSATELKPLKPGSSSRPSGGKPNRGEVLAIDPRTRVEPFFWLAQTLVGWSISGIELMYQQFKLQAEELGVKVTRGDEPTDEFLSNHLGDIDTDVRTKHGETASNVFRFGSLVALLPLSFNDAAQFRALKATCESLALRSFGSDGLATTAMFLNELPCDIPEFVKKVETFKKLLQKAISNEGVA
jgi:hypothetical protein